MATYTYTARTGLDALVEGTLEARSADDVALQLARRGLQLLDCDLEADSVWQMDVFPKRVKAKERVVFSRQFATLITSGMPLVHALAVLAEQADNPELTRVLEQIRADVESGETLAEAMRQHPRVFDPLYTAMVEAGESGGILDEILNRLATFQEKSDSIARKVGGAMVYPITVIGIAIAAVAILLWKVVPVFTGLFESAHVPLPLPTRVVMLAANALQSWWWAGAVALVGIGLLARQWYRSPEGRDRADRWLLAIPLIGTLIRRAAVARFTRTMGTLTKSGVPILEGLHITAATAGNRVIEDAILDARTAISNGDSIHTPLRASGQFPPMVCAMIAVGEQTGGLDEMLLKVADFYDAEVETAVDALLKAMEPMLIVLLGGIIGSTVVALYLPILSMAKLAQNGGF